MKRRLIALLLCIAMIGSMTVYAVGDDPVCTCGTATEEHAADCALLAEPAPEPETDPVCTCGTATEEHEAECALYVAPAEPTCTCGTATEEHEAECPLYVAPAPVEPASNETETKSTGPAVGDKIWINSGSNVYRNMNDKHSHSLWGNYEVKIEEIVYDDNGAPAWYRFSFTSFGVGEAVLHSYKYVKVENTSVTNPEEPSEPEDPRACTCGEAAQENLAYHMDSCPRKQYVKSLFEGKTAEEIYASWDAYDDGIRIDLLNMLQVWDEAKWLELKYLVDTQPEGPEGSDSLTTEDGNIVLVNGIANGAKLAVAEPDAEQLSVASVAAEDHFAAMRSSRTPNKIRDLFAYDISIADAAGNAWQPDGTTVKVELTIPTLQLDTFEKVYIAHNHDGVVDILEADVDFINNTISFETDGFSTFYGFIVDFEYNGHKFSIEGGSEAQLSEIFEGLNIDREVSEVSEITFSNNSLIEITFEEGDYKLKSLQSFGTDEWLVVKFTDGTTIEIKVTDPVLYYYLNGTDWCMDTFTSVITQNGGAAAPSGEVVINKDAITGSGLGATHANKDDGKIVADVIIYARPGMAIRFDRYSTFDGIFGPDAISTDGRLRWVWGKDTGVGSDTTGYNYVVISDSITAIEESSFTARIGDNGDATSDYVSCEVKIIIVPDGPAPTLLNDALNVAPDNIKNTYSIREVPVTLYNYDGNKYKEKYKGGDFFSFKGVSKGNKVEVEAGNMTDLGEANGSGPLLGILKDTLDANGLPVMSEGKNVDLFSQNTFDGKEIRNVMFEFVYDTEGYYTYSSNINHAQLSDDGTKVQLYREAMGTTADYALNGSDPNYAAGGFYPYSDIRKAADSAGDILDWTTWTERLATGYVKDPAPFGKDLVNSATTTAPVSTVDMHNGLQLAVDFYLPADKRTPSGNEIVYQFTGDDDLWVFIDDKLVLDIGGGHVPESGSINFTTGVVTLEGTYYTVGSSTQKSNYTKTHTFEGDQIHSLKVFYLERYAGVSNCRMRFNVPIIPEGAVLVSKNVQNEYAANEFAVTPDKDYTFTVYTALDDDNNVDAAASAFAPLANTSYTIVGTNEGGTTDANGKFTLKSGQTALFEGITHFNEVYVIEDQPNDGYVYVKPKVSVNGAALKDYTYGDKSDTLVMPDGTITFSFNNYIDVSDLTITKDLIDPYSAVTGAKYEVELKLDGQLYSGAAQLNGVATTIQNGKFILGNDDVMVIEKIPTNTTYSIVETTPEPPIKAPATKSGYKYLAPTYGDGVDANGKNDDATTAPSNIKLTADTEVVITNELKQLFGNLTITKDGIDPLDHHAADETDKEERQSTIYVVSGTSYSGEVVNMEVVIVGNDSVTINHLPIGEYTVEEKTDWSWRYTIDGNNERPVEIEEDKTAATTYNNKRTNGFWLSGDSVCSNWWGGQNNTVTKRG